MKKPLIRRNPSDQSPKYEEISELTHLGIRDSEGETPGPSLSEPSTVLAHDTLLDIPSEEQNPDRYTPIDGEILFFRLGTVGEKNPDAFAIYRARKEESRERTN